MASTINANTSGGLIYSGDTSGVLQLQTASTTALTVDTSANVGIGTASPSQKLSVAGLISSTGRNLAAGFFNSTNVTGVIVDATSADFYTNNAFAMGINSAGGVKVLNTLGVGNTTPSTSGAGITFPATQSASSDANTLDDYEEGTWSPTVFIGATEVTSYHFQNGSYTRVGRIVHANCWVRVNNKGAGTGAVSIRGLPFNIAGGNSSYIAGTVGYIDEVLSSSAPMYCFGTINSAMVSLSYGTATGLVDVNQSNLNAGQFMIQISYPTAT
jgi:hypothetical protein